MMSKILICSLLLSSSLWAQDASEDAIILNQELQFLEESVNNISITTASGVDSPARSGTTGPTGQGSLEDLYFGGNSDTVQTRTAAPARRRRN